MKMNEKILRCRKRLGMSQEELAQQLNTSRQAVSQWELGNAQPELNNVIALARLFGVTTDWLLLDDEETERAAPEQHTETEAASQPETQRYDGRPEYARTSASDSWVEHLPNVICRMIRRYGWMYGVYLALGGLLFTVMGGTAVSISNSMLNYGNNMMSGMEFGGMGGFNVLYDEAGAVITDSSIYRALGMAEPSFDSATGFPNPVASLGTLIIVIGVFMMIGGTILAVYLKKKADETK